MKKQVFYLLCTLLMVITLTAKAQVKVLSNGNVGINTTTPPARFTINGSQTKTTGIAVKSGDVDLVLTEDITTNGGKIQVYSGGSSTTIGSSTYRLLLQPEGGNVGIGTTAPNNLLQVTGLINFDDSKYNTFLGSSSGTSNSTGTNNTFLGYQTGLANTTGYYNTFIGTESGKTITTGISNTFVGFQSGKVNTASQNTFSGTYSGVANTSGSYNTFYGYAAGLTNITGAQSTYLGAVAGAYSTGNYNSFIGCSAGYTNSSGNFNSFMGWKAGYYNTTGSNNTFVGNNAGYQNTTASYNTAIGYLAGQYVTTGSNNTYLGYNSGSVWNVTGISNGTFVGYEARADGNYSNATAIGNGATVTGSNKVRIGNANVTEIGGAVSWTNYSDGRFKTNVTENVKGLEFINKLRPVTYNVNTQALDAFLRQNIPQETDSSGNVVSDIPVDYSASMAVVHSGFIAQEVDSAAHVCGFSTSIVHTPNNNADPYALSYAEFVVPLVKAVQELNAIINDQVQQKQVLESQIEELNEQINTIETNLAQCCTVTPTNKITGKNTNLNSQSVEAKLYQNIPNPFNEKTVIRYSLPEGSISSSLLIFDMQGKLIKTYGINTTGEGKIEISAGELQPGMYMYSLIENGKEVDTKKMILTD